jgi:hypothetical protein
MGRVEQYRAELRRLAKARIAALGPAWVARWRAKAPKGAEQTVAGMTRRLQSPPRLCPRRAPQNAARSNARETDVIQP